MVIKVRDFLVLNHPYILFLVPMHPILYIAVFQFANTLSVIALSHTILIFSSYQDYKRLEK